ncbi:ArnT family glycosyltransferase [Deminuibacter soli]|uniref:Phospholipid carrier-dependent glycosyltransferase n=1 Tax=Deminuibacter soli TaxID=2291815 RepID=A0A3E1NL29_9BACT|nr:glycosyltransferase family 39 protein [Deminuibacter soli]RFM28633.1 phospholipid carrier-dependent glycosyltransferase [Deminuibacter soli]
MAGTINGLSTMGIDTTSRWQKKFFEWSCFLLLVLVYLSHLGYTPIDTETDEARRAIVTLEMVLSGDYISPTINGALYLNKPPFYNWIVAAFFKLAGSHSMFVFRLPVIVAVIITGFIVYKFVKKYTNQAFAFLAAFTFMTNGRILIYDSLQGLIDETFTIGVYLSFMLIYYYGEQKKYYHLFITTYILTAIGFLMKGLPAFIFQGITLLVYFIFFDKFKKLFHLAHFIGGFICLAILGAYYYVYFKHTQMEPGVLFSNLLTESTKRTVAGKGWMATITHFIFFPAELLYHFLPWTIFVVALLNKKVLQYIKENPFIKYNALILLFNILVYWTSPEVMARYLFMFVPLIFTVMYYVLFRENENGWQQRTLLVTVLVVCAIMLAFSVVSIFLPVCNRVPNAFLKSISLVIAFALILWGMIRYKQSRYYLFIMAVLVFRMTFNWFIVAQRADKYFHAEADGKQVAAITAGQPLYILQHAQVGNFDGMTFHISNRRNEILRFKPLQPGNAYFIADKKQLDSIPAHNTYFSFTNYLSDSLFVVQLKQ